MTISITIDGDEFPVLINSLSAQLNAGLGGVELNASVTNLGVSPPNPASNSKVELSLGGLDFVCRLSRVTEDTKGRLCVYQLSASGPQERLRRAAPAIDIRTTTGASSLLMSLVGGTGLGSSIPDDKDVVGGFASGGTVIDSIERLCGAANMVSYLAPDGTVYLYDRDNLPDAPFDWIVDDVATLISGLKKTAQSELPITRTVVHGGVKLDFEGQDPEETRTLLFNGDGSTKWFGYPSITDEITDIRVASASQTVTYHGSGLDESTFDVVNYRNEYRLFWNTAPASGTGNIEVDITIQRATAQADDLTTQADLAAKFTDWDGVVIDEYQDENIRTQDQALQVAETRLTQLNTNRREASAVVESGSLFLPCRKLTVTDPRTNWNYVLFVQSNSLQWDTGKGRWKQNVSLTNALPSGAGGGGSGLSGVGKALAKSATRPASSGKLPPRERTNASRPMLNVPYGISFDDDGNGYIGDRVNERGRKVSAGTGIISTFAGNGGSGVTGDGGAATSAEIGLSFAGFVLSKADSEGNYYVSSLNDTVRKVTVGTGIIDKFAGTGTPGDTGNGGPATSAQIESPRAITTDSAGNVWFVCLLGGTTEGIKKVDSGGTITEFVSGTNGINDLQESSGKIYFIQSNGDFGYYESDGSGPTILVTGSFGISDSFGLATDGTNWYVPSLFYGKIYKIDGSNTVTDFAGTGTPGYSGDGGPAIDAQLKEPIGLCVYGGSLYVADSGNACIRKINLTTGTITLFAGTPPTPGFGGDGGPAM